MKAFVSLWDIKNSVSCPLPLRGGVGVVSIL